MLGNEELVLEELDSVLNNASYHSSSSGSKSNSSGNINFLALFNCLLCSWSHLFRFTILGKKKRVKDGHKSGGTWPRARCGPIIEQGTGSNISKRFEWSCNNVFFHPKGTILHPQKMKKERLPLVELLYNMPKYPIESKISKYRQGYS